MALMIQKMAVAFDQSLCFANTVQMLHDHIEKQRIEKETNKFYTDSV